MSDALDFRDSGWDDLVRGFDTGCLFHTSGWLEYLSHTQDVRVVAEPFASGVGDGVHVALLTRRGPFKLAGSPLPGWRTMRMGPLVGDGYGAVELAAECERFGRSLGVSLYELVSPAADVGAFARAGWHCEDYGTLAVELPADTDALWSGLKKAVRGRIKKGRKNGLEVRIGLDDSLVRDVWERADSIMRHKGLRLDWDEPHGRALRDALAPRDQLLGVRLVAEDGHTAACGLFPFDDRTVYYWAGASFAHDRAFVPSELMHWSVMEWAVEHGLRRYDMYGSGDYKLKYGARFVAHPRAMRFYNPIAHAARSAYAAALSLRTRIATRGSGGAAWD